MLIWERRLAVIATDLAIQYDELVRLRARVKSALAAPSPHRPLPKPPNPHHARHRDRRVSSGMRH
jgi:hypothetical protein